MNNIGAGFIGGIIGSAITTIAGYFIIKKIKEKEIVRADHDIEQVRKYYQDKADGKIKGLDKEIKEEKEEKDTNSFYEKSSLEGHINYIPKKGYTKYKPSEEPQVYDKKINEIKLKAIQDHDAWMQEFKSNLEEIDIQEFLEKEEILGEDNTARLTYYLKSDVVVNEESKFMETELVECQIAAFGGYSEVQNHIHPDDNSYTYYNKKEDKIYMLTVEEEFLANLYEYKYDEVKNPKPYPYPAWFIESEHELVFK